MKRVEFYFRNIVRRWQGEVGRKSRRILVLMPYLTSGTSEAVLRDADPETCEIYTVFSAENFAHGSSSLKTIKLLHAQHFRLYHLPNLHAKAVIVSGSFASIGSQNLTVQGGRNREASAVFTDCKMVATIESLAETWLHERQEISAEMIREMEELLPPLVKQFKKAKKDAAEINDAIFRCEDERLEETRLEVERSNRHLDEDLDTGQKTVETTRQWLAQLRKTILRLPQASEKLYGRVTGRFFDPFRKKDKSLTRWIIDDAETQLERLTRYPCLLFDSGKFAWPRVCQGRLSYIEPTLSRTDKLITCGWTDYKPSFRAIWQDVESTGSNLVVTLRHPNGGEQIEFKTLLGIDSLAIVGQEMKNVSPLKASLLERWIVNNDGGFKNHLLELILSPFKYEEKLTGKHAEQFFGSGWYEMTLRRTGSGHLLLVAETFPRNAA